MNLKLLLSSFVVLLLVSSCKTLKKPLITKDLATKKIILKYDNAVFSRKTVQAKIKVHYKDPDLSQNVTIKLRLQKDQIIWMSASFLGFPVAKAKITPDKVEYYEKIKKTYFSGDFSLLSSVLGTDINFDQLQNLLFGQSLSKIDATFISDLEGTSFKFTPKEQARLFELFYWINPTHYKIDKQVISSTKEAQSLTISYPEYQTISAELFPKTINIEAIEPKKTTQITMDFKNVEFDNRLSFPFKIPSHYKEIKIK